MNQIDAAHKSRRHETRQISHDAAAHGNDDRFSIQPAFNRTRADFFSLPQSFSGLAVWNKCDFVGEIFLAELENIFLRDDQGFSLNKILNSAQIVRADKNFVACRAEIYQNFFHKLNSQTCASICKCHQRSESVTNLSCRFDNLRGRRIFFVQPKVF